MDRQVIVGVRGRPGAQFDRAIAEIELHTVGHLQVGIDDQPDVARDAKVALERGKVGGRTRRQRRGEARMADELRAVAPVAAKARLPST